MKKLLILTLVCVIILTGCATQTITPDTTDTTDNRETNPPVYETDPAVTLPPETAEPETIPHATITPETTEPEPDDNIVYTAEYYSGSYNGYDFVNYEDEEWGEHYKKAYPNKHFNDNGEYR